MTKRILIADDQVPDSSLSSEKEVFEFYEKQYNDAGFAKGFVFIYNFIKKLKSRGYKVDTTNNHTDIMSYISKNNYNAIVLDLGWFTIENLHYDDKMILGWELADQIKEQTSTPIIMFSNRFYEDDDLAKTAADKSLLPVYKSYDEECLKHIIVTLRFLTSSEKIDNILSVNQKVQALKMYCRLSNVLIFAICGTFVLLLLAIILSFKDQEVAAIMTTIFGVASTFINYTIHKQIKNYKKDLT